MDEQVIITSVLIDEKNTVSFVEICQQYPRAKDALIDLLEHGLIQSLVHASLEQAMFDGPMVHRLQKAMRLQHDLGVNTPGVVLAMELLDELDKLRHEMDILQRHIGKN